jgi:predicted ATPase/DNA-binding SARP family transcriptional activator
MRNRGIMMDARWTIELFNGLRVSLPGCELIRFPLRRSASLLAYLAYYPHRAHSREILIGMLWPEAEPQSGRNRFNLTLSALRQSLTRPDSGIETILSDRFTVQINPQAITTDVGAFEASLQAAAQAAGTAEHSPRLLAAVTAYGGELLAGYYEDWIVLERLRLAESYQETLLQLWRLQEAAGDIQGAIQSAHLLLASDPEHEGVQAELVRLQSLSRRSVVISSPTIPPVPSPVGDAVSTAASTPAVPEDATRSAVPGSGDVAPVSLQPGAVHNLPQQLNTFIGRAEEVAAWHRALQQPGKRLLTLTGFAGIGKTRIAAALAERSLPDFPDGVWWCEQAYSLTAEEMLRHLAEQLRLAPQPDLTVREQVHQFMAGRRLLLILDNLEQVAGAAGAVSDLLQVAPHIKVLVTSRRSLELRGETLLEINPLPEVEATSLFVERAQELRANFVLSAANEADVRDLCRRLEGVPLAIELAAARCIAMTPRQIVQRLNERFSLLQSRSTHLAMRQRALRNAIDWSYCLLGDEEKRIFPQLSVFVGGFTLEDAEAVCDGENVLESVIELCKHSFFRRETDIQLQQERFAMLETLREYGIEQLRAMGDESERIARRHAQYFLQLAREQVRKYRTDEELNAVWLLERQSGNLNAARQWAMGSSQPGLYAELSRLIGYRLLRRGFLHEATEVVQAGLTTILPLKADHPSLTAELLRERAGLHLDYGETRETRRLAQEALTIATDRTDAAAQARTENLLGQAAMHENERDYAAARHYLLRALAHAERAGDTVIQGNIYNNLGIVERHDISGDAAEQARRRADAARYLQTSLHLRRANHDRRGLAETLNSLGVLAFYAGDWEGAWRYYAESLALLLELQNTQQVALMLFNLGEVALKRGDPDRAVPLLAVSEYLLIELQSPLAPSVEQMLQQATVAAGAAPDSVTVLQSALKPISLAARVETAMSAAHQTSAPE